MELGIRQQTNLWSPPASKQLAGDPADQSSATPGPKKKQPTFPQRHPACISRGQGVGSRSVCALPLATASVGMPAVSMSARVACRFRISWAAGLAAAANEMSGPPPWLAAWHPSSSGTRLVEAGTTRRRRWGSSGAKQSVKRWPLLAGLETQRRLNRLAVAGARRARRGYAGPKVALIWQLAVERWPRGRRPVGRR